jgi:hypothetical protein
MILGVVKRMDQVPMIGGNQSVACQRKIIHRAFLSVGSNSVDQPEAA